MHLLCLLYDGNALCDKVCEQSADKCTYYVCYMVAMYYAIKFVKIVLTDATMSVIRCIASSHDRYVFLLLRSQHQVMFVLK